MTEIQTAATVGGEQPAEAPVPQEIPAPATPRPPRRVLRAFARWTCAVLAFAGAAAGTAYVVAEKERTELPGLATESDGRWDYPALRLPSLAKEQPGPFATGNEPEVHHADLRTLLLPAPKGAKVDKGLPGRGGWLSLPSFLEAYRKGDRAELGKELTEEGVKHIAATGWTMPDGTRTRIYLLRFSSDDVAGRVSGSVLGAGYVPNKLFPESEVLKPNDSWAPEAGMENVSVSVFGEDGETGKVELHQAHLLAGDLVGVIVQEKPGRAPEVPFHQTVILQSQLLG
ncbi:hypothetical protein ACFQLX_10865 [Streptomyces polyrhachis]|uniref:Uncharacterized protein n=1 Tax=Streptomyces polyrhachis TaxID=1282885 RepID=A0ABW2GD03_9ACTN